MHGQIDQSQKDAFFERTAFLLNANARRVTDKLVGQLIEEIPAGDLFYSRSKADAEQFLSTIVKRGYGRIFVGGGDGTVVHAMNSLKKIGNENPALTLPAFGLLKLGTGNALASILHAGNAVEDTRYLMRKSHQLVPHTQAMVVCDDGTLCPFAGIGYDGEMLNDYQAFIRRYARTPLKGLRESVLGYAWAGITKAIPRRLVTPKPHVRIRSTSTAYRMLYQNGRDIEVEIPAGTILYDGPAPMVSVGAIPVLGYGLMMFPFAGRKEEHMQLRVMACSLFSILPSIYPAVWKGKFRHPNLHDFLVRDVSIESSLPLPYQVGGDACGYRNQLSFHVENAPLEFVHFPKKRRQFSRIRSLLQVPSFARA